MSEEFSLYLRGLAAQDMPALAAPHRGKRFVSGTRVQVQGDELWMMIDEGGRHGSTIRLRARIESVPGGVRLVGRTGDRRGPFVRGIFAFCTLVLLSAFVAVLAQPPAFVPGLVVSGVGGVLLGFVTLGLYLVDGPNHSRMRRVLRWEIRRVFEVD